MSEICNYSIPQLGIIAVFVLIVFWILWQGTKNIIEFFRNNKGRICKEILTWILIIVVSIVACVLILAAFIGIVYGLGWLVSLVLCGIG